LVYRGNVWDVVQQSTVPQTTTSIPNRRSNAGMGWLLSLGRLVPPSDPTNDSHQDPAQYQVWVYESPDGGDHVFYDRLHDTSSGDGVHSFTRDGTYVRMTITGDDRWLEFPDGTYQVFREYTQNESGPWTATPGTDVWRLA